MAGVMDDDLPQSVEGVMRLLEGMGNAVEATTSAAAPLLAKIHDSDPTLDMASGLSLLLVRPQIMLSQLNDLVILLALQLSSSSAAEHSIDPSTSTALTSPFSRHQRDRRDLQDVAVDVILDEIAGELRVGHEVLEKVRGMEGKLDYQIKKLIGLADAEAKRGSEVVDDVAEDPLSFRPNPSALASSSRTSAPAKSRSSRTHDNDDNDDGTGESSQLYRPPRVAAVPYSEPSSKSQRSDRRAPALLSEFAQTMDNSPLLESTSGLSTRPVQANRHTNSISGKRAAELARMEDFENENMTRLVTTKREMKRRREDEASLALGYGVGGPAKGRGRRQNGLEAELEGVLGDRRSKGLWEGVGKSLGQREGVVARGKGRAEGAGVAVKPKKARFDKDVKGHGRKSRA